MTLEPRLETPVGDDALSSGLTDAQGKRLIQLARASVGHAFGQPPALLPDEGWVHQHAATFVTIRRPNGDLHGCVGSLEPLRELGEDVRKNACAAAFHDPRTRPLRDVELPRVFFEVSVLSPIVELPVVDEADAIAKIVPHVDGIVLSSGERRATFLPQVWAQLPEPRTFLGRLKRKAGLPADGWPEDMKLYRYRSSKWKEDGYPRVAP